MRGKFQCFWCSQWFWKGQKTDDHLQPKSLGGNDSHENFVNSCQPCNQERGLITSWFCHAKKVQSYFAKWGEVEYSKRKVIIKHAKTLIRNLPRIVDVQRKWTEIEIDKCGVAYSGQMRIEPFAILSREYGYAKPKRTRQP